MKVYVITCGEYSDYRICAVTLSKRKAEKLKRKFDDRGYTSADIEEYETDDIDCVEANILYTVSFRENGDVKIVKEASNMQMAKMPPDKYAGLLHVTVWAENAIDAIKIAAEKRAKYLAEEQGM